MSSRSQEAVETSNTSLALDQRTVVEEGQAIVDSVILSNDPQVIDVSLRNLMAGWETMVKGGNLNLVEVVDLGAKLVNQMDKSQVLMSENAAESLRAGVTYFEDLLSQNKLNVQLIEDTQDRAFDTSDRALEIAAEVQTADYADLSKALMLFALAMLGTAGWIATKGR